MVFSDYFNSLTLPWPLTTLLIYINRNGHNSID